MSYIVNLSKQAQKDIGRHKKAGNKTVLRKINKLLNELSEHPYTGTGQPEALKYELTGKYSRKITGEHRLVYSVADKIVTVNVLSAYSHYGDK